MSINKKSSRTSVSLGIFNRHRFFTPRPLPGITIQHHALRPVPITIKLFFIIYCLIGLGACKPDKLEIEIYTSDLQAAREGEVILVPITAEFSMLGTADDADINEIKAMTL